MKKKYKKALKKKHSTKRWKFYPLFSNENIK